MLHSFKYEKPKPQIKINEDGTYTLVVRRHGPADYDSPRGGVWFNIVYTDGSERRTYEREEKHDDPFGGVGGGPGEYIEEEITVENPYIFDFKKEELYSESCISIMMYFYTFGRFPTDSLLVIDPGRAVFRFAGGYDDFGGETYIGCSDIYYDPNTKLVHLYNCCANSDFTYQILKSLAKEDVSEDEEGFSEDMDEEEYYDAYDYCVDIDYPVSELEFTLDTESDFVKIESEVVQELARRGHDAIIIAENGEPFQVLLIHRRERLTETKQLQMFDLPPRERIVGKEYYQGEEYLEDPKKSRIIRMLERIRKGPRCSMFDIDFLMKFKDTRQFPKKTLYDAYMELKQGKEPEIILLLNPVEQTAVVVNTPHLYAAQMLGMDNVKACVLLDLVDWQAEELAKRVYVRRSISIQDLFYILQKTVLQEANQEDIENLKKLISEKRE